MSPADRANQARMCRAAVLVPDDRIRDGLVEVAAAGCVDFDEMPSTPEDRISEALRRLPAIPADHPAALSRTAVDPEALERAGRRDLLEGELQLHRVAAGAVHHAGVAAFLGWMPAAQRSALAKRLEALGGAVVRLPRPRWVEPPTHLSDSLGRGSFHMLVDSYGVVPYADIDPTIFAATTYVVMFGMMFADLGQGAIIALAGILCGLQGRWAALRSAWVLITACGVSACFFGWLFGEFFGPTGVVHPLWLRPLDNPELLLLCAVVFGAVLLTASYGMGIVNRYREGGWDRTLLAASGIAGFAIFAAIGVLFIGIVGNQVIVRIAAAVLGLLGLVLLTFGLRREASSGSAAAIEIVVGMADTVVRLGTNLVSFARLAAFGLVHSAIEGLVWTSTASLVGRGWLTVLGVAVFLIGNAIAFALEGLVVAIQALRLEYYELFSRVFVGEGRRFHPWRLDIVEA